MDCIDLNLCNEALEEKARELGWKEALKLEVILLDCRGKPVAPSGKTLFSVESQDSELLRKALKKNSFFLINPYPYQQYYRDEFLVKELKENGKCFEIPLSEFLKNSFVLRAKVIAQTTVFLKKCISAGADYVFTSRAVQKEDLKSPREVTAIAKIFGLSDAQAKYAISERPREILEQKGKKMK